MTYFSHALALDEGVEQLLPERIAHNDPSEGHVKEVWFAGTRLDLFVDCLLSSWVGIDAVRIATAEVKIPD